MRPIIKFRYGKARCPLCLIDGGSRKQYESVREIRSHLNLDHSYNNVYFYTISSTPNYRGNYPFTVHGSCNCGCGEAVRFPTLTSTIPIMPDHCPPYYSAGHKSRLGPNPGMFKKGIIPWNKGTKGKGICKPNSGSFKKGNIPSNERGGLYTATNGQVLEWTGGYQPSGPRKYKPRSRRIIEELLGRPLQDHEVVIHLDGDSSNDDPDNLKLITRAENAIRNRWGYRQVKQKIIKKKAPKKRITKIKKPKQKLIKIKTPKQRITRIDTSNPFCSKCKMLKPAGGACPRCV